MYRALYYLAFIELSYMGHCSQYLKDFQHVPEHNNIYKNLAEFKHLANNKKLQIIIISKKNLVHEKPNCWFCYATQPING